MISVSDISDVPYTLLVCISCWASLFAGNGVKGKDRDGGKGLVVSPFSNVHVCLGDYSAGYAEELGT